MTTSALKTFVYTLTFCMAMQSIQTHQPGSMFYQSLSGLLLSGSGTLFATVTAYNPLLKVILGLGSTSDSESTNPSYYEGEETAKESTEDSTEKSGESSYPVTAEEDPHESSPPAPPEHASYPDPQTKDPTPLVCKKSRYRTFDGSCNNLKNPTWGMTQRSHARMTPYNYANGNCSMPRSVSGDELPNARGLSNIFFMDKKKLDYNWTSITQQWGQILTHDMILTARVTQRNKEPAICCDKNGKLAPDAATNPLCAPIMIPPNDPTHAPFGTQCMNFIRSGTACSTCSYERPAEPQSNATAYIDQSLVYGNSATLADSLRSGVGGKMKTTSRNGQEWPPQATNAAMMCDLRSPDDPCYLTGDARMNQSPNLAILQVVMVREHNRLADGLTLINPHWDDEKLFQEARRIHIAEIQHINYYEYLPILLGIKNMVEKKLIFLNKSGYVNDYDPSVNATILSEFTSAAFRFFHTLIFGFLQLLTESRTLLDALRLSDHFNRPKAIEYNFPELTRGLCTQKMGASDQYCDNEITQFLFRGNKTNGVDLRAIDLMRARDHGLPTYINMRKVCNLTVPKNFKDMSAYISKENVDLLKKTYYSIKDVDLAVAGSLEYNVKGALVGPTFLCILLEQFHRTKVGDRFFYEMGHDPDIRFTLSQLQSIRKGSSMARLVCDNTDGILQMQPRAFHVISHENKLVPCHELPSIDLSLWKDKS